MYHCVLANPKAKLFDPLMTILSHFHLAKNNRKIQTMVQKLWEPLLWRYLKVANGHVRMHATQILAEAFPIENPNDELEIRANAQEVQVRNTTKVKSFTSLWVCSSFLGFDFRFNYFEICCKMMSLMSALLQFMVWPISWLDIGPFLPPMTLKNLWNLWFYIWPMTWHLQKSE